MINVYYQLSVTYGAETSLNMNTTKHIEQKLMTTQRAMERTMLIMTIRDKIINSEIRKRTKVKDVMLKVKEARKTTYGQRGSQNGNLDMEEHAEADRNAARPFHGKTIYLEICRFEKKGFKVVSFAFSCIFKFG